VVYENFLDFYDNFKNKGSKRTNLGINILKKKVHQLPKAIVFTNPITSDFFNSFSQHGYQNYNLEKI
jgi:hypothetical protein